MSDDTKALMKALKARIATKAMQTFDRSTVIVVGACWGVAILMMLFAVYAVILSASTRRAAETAAASEPILPKAVHKPINAHDAQSLVDRLKRLYPDLTITLNNDGSVNMSTNDGPKFREWLIAVSYIDVMAPQFRWAIREFCVGKCSGAGLMHAVLTGEKISFEAPQPGEGDKH